MRTNEPVAIKQIVLQNLKGNHLFSNLYFVNTLQHLLSSNLISSFTILGI